MTPPLRGKVAPARAFLDAIVEGSPEQDSMLWFENNHRDVRLAAFVKTEMEVNRVWALLQGLFDNSDDCDVRANIQEELKNSPLKFGHDLPSYRDGGLSVDDIGQARADLKASINAETDAAVAELRKLDVAAQASSARSRDLLRGSKPAIPHRLQLTGYAHDLGWTRIEIYIDPEHADFVKQVAGVPATDPKVLGAYPLNDDQVTKIVERIQFPVCGTDVCNFFLECYV